VAEGESDAARKLPLDPLDRAKRLARVGAFVIAVLENDGVARLPTHVIHVPVEWLDQWSFVRDAHQNPTCCRTLSTRLGLPEIAPVGSTSGPDSRRTRNYDRSSGGDPACPHEPGGVAVCDSETVERRDSGAGIPS